jgi:thiol-disulfide isomerase/thioredoxin
MSGVVEDVNDGNYEGFLQAPAAVVAYGIATCEPCKAYDPVLVEVAQQYSDVRFGKAKMHIPGRCREIKKRHQFETYPTTHFFSHGTLVLTKEGKMETAELSTLIKQYFSCQT